MTRGEKYRHYAADCVRVAQEISSPADKALLLQMAETWVRLAERTDGKNKPNDGT